MRSGLLLSGRPSLDFDEASFAVDQALEEVALPPPKTIKYLRKLRPNFSVVIKSSDPLTFYYLMAECWRYESRTVLRLFGRTYFSPWKFYRRQITKKPCVIYIPIIKYLGKDEYLFSVYRYKGVPKSTLITDKAVPTSRVKAFVLHFFYAHADAYTRAKSMIY